MQAAGRAAPPVATAMQPVLRAAQRPQAATHPLGFPLPPAGPWGLLQLGAYVTATGSFLSHLRNHAQVGPGMYSDGWSASCNVLHNKLCTTNCVRRLLGTPSRPGRGRVPTLSLATCKRNTRLLASGAAASSSGWVGREARLSRA